MGERLGKKDKKIACTWMSREDILSFLNIFGLDDIRIGLDPPEHSNDSVFSPVGIRTKSVAS